MADFINLKTDFDDATQLFNNLEKEAPKIRRRMLAGVGTTVKNRVKKEYRRLFNKKEGNLYESIKRYVTKSGKAVIIETKARAANHVFYGYALTYGSTIEAKHSDYLTFQIDGKWVKKQSVKLPVRDFVEGPADKYLGSYEYKAQLDKLMQKEINKLEKKGITVIR